MAAPLSRFEQLDFDGFRALAVDPGLSRHEKVGFPDSYREGKEEAIFRDMLAKLPSLQRRRPRVLEIGPGCSGLPLLLAEHCAQRAGQITFVDSAEMLALLPDAPHARHFAGRFPDALRDELARLAGGFDTIVAYSVLQYVFAEANLFHFVDSCLALLAEGGELLLGDLPNATMRKRFFASGDGVATHQRYTGRQELPDVRFNQIEPGAMDDAVVLGLLARVRAQGLHAANATEPQPNRDVIYNLFEQIGCVQIDTISVVRRSHYLVLWSRLGNYDPADFDALSSAVDRRLFEGWQHAASIIPLAEYRYQMPHQRYLRGHPAPMSDKWLAEPGSAELLEQVRERIRQNGAVRGGDFEPHDAHRHRSPGGARISTCPRWW